MKKLLLAAAVASAATGLSSTALAQAKAPEPEVSVAYNIGVVTDYRYRGISQTRFKPALQGGADLTTKSGFYAGVWATNIQWIKDGVNGAFPGQGKGSIEVDLYGGYKGSINKDLGFDVGLLQYWYPSNNYNRVGSNANTLELYGALTYGPVTAKYSHSLTNLFGFAAPGVDSKGSGYLDVNATFDMGNGWSIVPHIGYQRVKGFSNASYTDYSLAVSKDIDGLILSASLIGTNAKKIGGVPVYSSPSGKNLGRSGLVLGVKKNF